MREDFGPGNRGDCQDCGEAPATHVCMMTIGMQPVGPLYVCAGCYPVKVKP